MKNNNWNLITQNFQNYFVLNKISEISILFKDDEADNIIVRVQSSLYYNSFVKYLSSNAMIVMIQPDGNSGDQFEFSLDYTDSFHQNDRDWRSITQQMILFNSEPPVFNTDLDAIYINKCNDYNFALPNFSDPDSYNISVKLADEAPKLIILNKNNTVSIYSKSDKNIIEGLTQVYLVLIDETNSWSKYTLNITVSPLISPVFSIIPNVKQSQLEGDGVFINVTSSKPIDVIDWK